MHTHKVCNSKHAINRAIILFTTLSACLFSITECRVLMALVFYFKDMLEKVTMQRTQQLSAFICYQTQLNAEHAQLVEKLRPIAFAETCRFLN